LFNESVYDNLRLGNPEASDQDVVRIAKLAGAHEFVDLLPAGYNTNIGEQGGFISGGEAQRLGLTRTLLREASLFLLDEPFAHLDPISRNALLDSTLTFLAEKSVLLVTHQIEGLAAMDEILVFDEGRVAERGTHTELIQANGMYSEMWRISQEIFLDQ
jgi:ABC-type multidrug transport system fused ATPase/permease subunit